MSETWETTTQYGRADLRLHPAIRTAYMVACLIERCGGSPALTTASSAAFRFVTDLYDWLKPALEASADSLKASEAAADEIERLRAALAESLMELAKAGQPGLAYSIEQRIASAGKPEPAPTFLQDIEQRVASCEISHEEALFEIARHSRSNAPKDAGDSKT